MKIIDNVPYCNDAVTRQHLKIYLPETDEFDVFVYIHGGGLFAGSHDDCNCFAEKLCDNGIAVVGLNYRLYPNASYPDFLKDAAAGVAWVKNNISEYGKMKRLIVGGSSAGGYISMMLCFDKRWLGMHGIAPDSIDGYVHDAGQPTCHFNVLKERGIDSRRVIIDETAPLYHIGTAANLSPMLFVVSDNDMENRYEQTQLVISTLKHFRYDMSKVQLKVMHGTHCHYIRKDGGFDDVVLEFFNSLK